MFTLNLCKNNYTWERIQFNTVEEAREYRDAQKGRGLYVFYRITDKNGAEIPDVRSYTAAHGSNFSAEH